MPLNCKINNCDKNAHGLGLCNKHYMRHLRSQGKCKEHNNKHKATYKSKHPWFTSYSCTRQRCNVKSHHAYKTYGAKGIKLLMTINDFKDIWFRDEAYLMKKPTMDRIDCYGNYSISNCRFIEFSENVKRPRRKNKKIGGEVA